MVGIEVITYIRDIVIAVSALLTAFSIIYAKLIKPVIDVVDKIEENEKRITTLEKEVARDRKDSVIMMESLIAVLDGLEQNGANGEVTKTKKKLISYITNIEK